jgi:hypothetical protein
VDDLACEGFDDDGHVSDATSGRAPSDDMRRPLADKKLWITLGEGRGLSGQGKYANKSDDK